MVSAFATGARLVLAQQKVAEKSNEMTEPERQYYYDRCNGNAKSNR